jgi:hypothetical protein
VTAEINFDIGCKPTQRNACGLKDKKSSFCYRILLRYSKHNLVGKPSRKRNHTSRIAAKGLIAKRIDLVQRVSHDSKIHILPTETYAKKNHIIASIRL